MQILLLNFKNKWGKIACLFKLNVIYWYLRCGIQNLHIKIFMSVKRIWSVCSVNMESYTGPPPYSSRMPTSVSTFLQDIISNAYMPQSGELHLLSEEQYWSLTLRCYNPCRVLADSRSRLQPSLSLALLLQFLTPSLSTSLITPSIHLRFDLPTRLLPSLSKVNFFTW